MSKRTDQVKSCLEYLQSITDLLDDIELKRISKLVLNHPKFIECPASSAKYHHVYEGGLVVHTAEVMEYCLALCDLKSLDVSKTVLVPAVIFHDYGKTQCYGNPNTDGTFESTQERKLIDHICISYSLFTELARNVPNNLKNKISHCILAHHGKKEWGSPVEPQTIEALILHQADLASAFYAKNLY